MKLQWACHSGAGQNTQADVVEGKQGMELSGGLGLTSLKGVSPQTGMAGESPCRRSQTRCTTLCGAPLRSHPRVELGCDRAMLATPTHAFILLHHLRAVPEQLAGSTGFRQGHSGEGPEETSLQAV